MSYVDPSILASAVISFLAGIVIAAISERGRAKEIILTICAGVAFTTAIYSLVRIALLLASRSGCCFYASPWELSQCYTDLLTMSGISGVSSAMGVYLLGLALRSDSAEGMRAGSRTNRE